MEYWSVGVLGYSSDGVQAWVSEGLDQMSKLEYPFKSKLQN